MILKRIKYAVIIMIASIALVGCTNVYNTKEYKELQANYKQLETKLNIKEQEIKSRDETIESMENEMKKLKAPKVEGETVVQESSSTATQYIEKYGVDVSNRKPFNETTISNLDIITNNGKDKLTSWEQECYFSNWNKVMLDQNNIWHFDEHCIKVTGNLDLSSLDMINLSVSKPCNKCGW